MKKTILLLVLVILNYSCKTNEQEPLAPNSYEIKGTAKGVVNGLRAYILLLL